MCQISAVLLSATAIVKEKEIGTLEQIFMTPVTASELVLGKIIPYLVVTFIEFTCIATLMVLVFGVPVNGYIVTLIGLTLPFVLTMLGLGLFISTKAVTRDAAQQMAMGTVIRRSSYPATCSRSIPCRCSSGILHTCSRRRG